MLFFMGFNSTFLCDQTLFETSHAQLYQISCTFLAFHLSALPNHLPIKPPLPSPIARQTLSRPSSFPVYSPPHQSEEGALLETSPIHVPQSYCNILPLCKPAFVVSFFHFTAALQNLLGTPILKKFSSSPWKFMKTPFLSALRLCFLQLSCSMIMF